MKLKHVYNFNGGMVMGALLAVLGLIVGLVMGCAAPGARAGTVDHNRVEAQADIRAELTAALAKIGEIETTLTGFQAGDIQIGGEGESITTWLLTVGLILTTPAGGLFYQFILRPAALPRRERKRRRQR